MSKHTGNLSSLFINQRTLCNSNADYSGQSQIVQIVQRHIEGGPKKRGHLDFFKK